MNNTSPRAEKKEKYGSRASANKGLRNTGTREYVTKGVGPGPQIPRRWGDPLRIGIRCDDRRRKSLGLPRNRTRSRGDGQGTQRTDFRRGSFHYTVQLGRPRREGGRKKTGVRPSVAWKLAWWVGWRSRLIPAGGMKPGLGTSRGARNGGAERTRSRQDRGSVQHPNTQNATAETQHRMVKHEGVEVKYEGRRQRRQKATEDYGGHYKEGNERRSPMYFKARTGMDKLGGRSSLTEKQCGLLRQNRLNEVAGGGGYRTGCFGGEEVCHGTSFAEIVHRNWRQWEEGKKEEACKREVEKSPASQMYGRGANWTTRKIER